MPERLRSTWQHVSAHAGLWFAHLRAWWRRASAPLRALVRPRSLARQMALGAVLIVVGAIIATALLAAIVVSNSFSSYLQSSLQQSAQIEAERLGAIAQENDDWGYIINRELFDKFTSGSSGQIWIMDIDGKVLIPPPPNTDLSNADANYVIPALRTALSGTATHGALTDPDQFSWLHLSARAYGAAPIILSTPTGNIIIGAVAISSQRAVGGGPAFIHSVDTAILISGLIVALIVGIIGAMLAQRLTQPIGSLTRAATKMGRGDLSARVRVNTGVPAEIEQLAKTFNAMAANLQRDVNELRRQEKLQRDLVANVAHELATPLTAISGYAEVLADDEQLDPADRTEFIHIIHRQSVRLGKLVDQLRQVARLESGAEKMDLHPVDLGELVNDTLAILQNESEQRRVAIHNQMAPDLPPVLADADRLTQVVLNLVENALRYTPGGGIVRLSAHVDGAKLWVNIADTGPGFAPEDLPHVFERFYRADKSRNSHSGGTGLGLAIVRAIVEAHGGQIRASNNPYGGALMAFSLHLAPVTTPPPATTQHDQGAMNRARTMTKGMLVSQNGMADV
jgi:two-component system sensor histidine kinase BaeS